MIRAMSRRLLGSRGGSSRVRGRVARPEVVPLESRHLLSVASLTATARPTILWPPNGRLVPVVVRGRVVDTTPAARPAAILSVHDDEGTVAFTEAIRLRRVAPDVYAYRVRLRLQARRAGWDRDGRQYDLTVTATDDGTARSATAVVTVPHDRGNHFGRRRRTIPIPGPRGDGGAPRRHHRVTIAGPARHPILVLGPGNGHAHGHGNGHGHGNANGHGNGHGHGKG